MLPVRWPRLAASALALFSATLLGALLAGCGLERHDPMRPASPSAASPTSDRESATHLGAPASDDAGGWVESVDHDRSESGRDFYPLALGNWWRYASRFQLTVTDLQGNPLASYDERTTIDRNLIAVVPWHGRDYVQELSAEYAPGWVDPILTYVYYRQDRSGLYEADVTTPPGGEPSPVRVARAGSAGAWAPPGSSLASRRSEAILRLLGPGIDPSSVNRLLERIAHATGAALAARTGRPGGPLDHEITRLAYPLRVAQHWIIRADPRFEAEVEHIGPVEVPAGRFVAPRIRITSVFFGPSDRVLVWYGRSGFLKLEAHGEGDALDYDGHVIGHMVAETSQELTRLLLVGRDQHDPGHGALEPSAEWR